MFLRKFLTGPLQFLLMSDDDDDELYRV